MARKEDRGLGLGDAAGRAAFFPARAAARAWRNQLAAAVDEVLSAPEMAHVIDRALAGPLPEEVARSIVRHRVVERVVSQLESTGELERLFDEALRSSKTLELTDRALASEQVQHALRHIASSPELRAAIAEQTGGFAEEVLQSLRSSAARLDDRFEEAVSRRRRAEHPVYAGIATRALALATDAVLAVIAYTGLVGIVALFAALVGGLRPQWLVDALLGVGLTLTAGTYFVLFWSAAAQTPGMRLLHLRLQGPRDGKLSVGRSIVRVIGLALSIIPMFAGFVPVLFDRRRRGLADFLARTSVVYDNRGTHTNPPTAKEL